MNETVRVIAFDFDGTLVDSNKLKYDAFFTIFPDNDRYRGIVRNVLDENLAESREFIIEKIVREAGTAGGPGTGDLVPRLAGEYNDIVTEGVKKCPEIPEAEKTLGFLRGAGFRLYLISGTPEIPLGEILRFRGWDGFFDGVYGYPRSKKSAIEEILKKERVRPRQVLVVGDRPSDKICAEDTGCGFFLIDRPDSMAGLIKYLRSGEGEKRHV